MTEILKELIDSKTPESETVDYKETVPDDIGKDIAAMANTDGGHIAIGIKDDDGVPGDVAGLGSSDHAALSVENKSKDTVSPPPKIKVHRLELNGKKVLLIVIPPSRSIHTYWQKNTASIPMRRGAQSVPMTKEKFDAKVGFVNPKSARAGKPVKQYRADVINEMHWEWDYDSVGKPTELKPHCRVCETELTIKDDINSPRDRTAPRGLIFTCPTCNKSAQNVNVLTQRELIQNHVVPKIENQIRLKKWKTASVRLKPGSSLSL